MQTQIVRRSLCLLALSSLPVACSRDAWEEGLPARPQSSLDSPRAEPDGQKSDPRSEPLEAPGDPDDLAARERLAARSLEVERVGRHVPHVLGGSECTKSTPLDTCTWAAAADAVVVATVRALRLTDTPVAGPAEHGEWKWYGACSLTRPALEIDLEVEHDFAGKLAGNTTVHIGKRQLDTLSPSPYRSADGSLAWNGDPGGSPPLAEGQRVLVGLHYVRDLGVWSLMGEMFSGIDAEGSVHVPRGGCMARAPIELDQLKLGKASERIQSCLERQPTVAARDWRAKRRRAFGDEKLNGSGAHPANYVAAECIQPDFALPAADR